MNDAKFNQPAPQLGQAGLNANEFAYRSVSKAAIASLTFAIFGAMTAFLGQPFVLIPALGFGFGLMALANFRRFPDELTGKGVSKVGLILSLVILVTSVAYHGYVYATEVPPDHMRIAFSDLRPNPKTPNIPFSEKSMELDGKKVFLKGMLSQSRSLAMIPLTTDTHFAGSPEPFV